VERLHAIVRGRVQGVGFRYWALREARFLNLTGWVRNTPGGAVEVMAEGARDSLLSLLASLRDGPSNADVESVEPRFGPATGEFSDFRIV
jgi:acylphosphatase